MKSNNKAVLSFTGWSDSGKTTLIARLIEYFTLRGYKVGAVKSTHQLVALDKEGSDSNRFYESGAGEVLLISRDRSYLFLKQRTFALEKVLSLFEDSDLIVMEGLVLPGCIHLEVAGLEGSDRELKNPLGDQDILITDSQELSLQAAERGIPVFSKEGDSLFLYLEERIWKEK